MAKDFRVKNERNQLKEEGAIELNRIVASEALGKTDLAGACGIGASCTSRWCTVEAPQTPTLVDLIMIGRRYPAAARRMLSWAAGKLGLMVVERPSAGSESDRLDLLSRLTRSSGDAISELAQGLKDAHLTDAQLLRMLRAITGSAQVNAEAREMIEAELAQRRNVVAFRARGAA